MGGGGGGGFGLLSGGDPPSSIPNSLALCTVYEPLRGVFPSLRGVYEAFTRRIRLYEAFTKVDTFSN